MNEPDMLVVKLLWFFGFLLLFMILPTTTLPMLPADNSFRMNKDLADKYGKLLSAIVALNEERMDTMKKLYRLQDASLRTNLRTGSGKVYPVWKVEGKPAWRENISEYDDILQTDDTIVIIISLMKSKMNKESPVQVIKTMKTSSKEDSNKRFFIRNKFINDGIKAYKVKSIKQSEHVKKINSLEFWSGKEGYSVEDIKNEKDESKLRVPIEKFQNNLENSSLEFWEGPNEGLSEENRFIEDGRNAIGDKQESSEKLKLHTVSNTSKITKGSQLVSSKEYSYINEELVQEINYKYHPNGTHKQSPTEIIKVYEELSSLEYRKGSKENLLNKDLSEVVEFSNKRNFENSDIQINNINKIVVPMLIKKSEINGNLYLDTREYEKIKEILDKNILNNKAVNAILKPKRRYNRHRKKSYKYAISCSRHAVRYCKRACKDAFDYMCGSFKCTSLVKRNYKKECRYSCKMQFTREAEDSTTSEEYSSSEEDSSSESEPRKKRKVKHERNTHALSTATFYWR